MDNRISNVDLYTEYYLNQIGSGYGSIYSGPVYQKGYGIGSFLGGLFRSVFPLVRKGSVALGSELLKSGVGFLKDISHEDAEVALKNRSKEVIKNLSSRAADHMFGSGYGYKPITIRKRRQSNKRASRKWLQKKKKPSKNKKKKITKRKRKRGCRSKDVLQDIFS